MKNALKRFGASVLLGLSLIVGSAQVAAAQTYLCELIYWEMVLYDDGGYEETQIWYCVPINDQQERQQDLA
jgi:hypothetical protein